MKPFYQSITIWLNVLGLAAGWLLNHQGVFAAAGIDADTQLLILGFLNIVVRWKFTRTAINLGV